MRIKWDKTGTRELRIMIACLKTHSLCGAEPGFKPRKWGSRAYVLPHFNILPFPLYMPIPNDLTWYSAQVCDVNKDNDPHEGMKNREVIYQASDKTRSVLRLSETCSKTYTAISDCPNSSNLSWHKSIETSVFPIPFINKQQLYRKTNKR